MDISAGKKFQLIDDFGVGPGMVPAGAEVTVTGVYPPGTPGIGAIDEEIVLATYRNNHNADQVIALGVTQFKSLVREVS